MSRTLPSPADPIQDWEVLDLLTSLVEKSLILYEEDEHGHGRYRLLETVRQYSRDRLLESKEIAKVRDRHLQLFLQVAEEAQSQYVGPLEIECLERLETEHDNLRIALEWSIASDNADPGLRLGAALGWFWFLHVHRHEGVQWLEQLLALSPGTPTVTRARALCNVGLLALLGKTSDQARRRLEESLALFGQLGNDRGIARSLNLLALLQESYEQGLALTEESVALARDIGDRQLLLDVLTGYLHRLDRRRDPERQRAAAEEVMALSQELGSVFGSAMAYRAMEGLARDTGELAQARRYRGEELVRIVALKDWVGVHGALSGLADLAARQGDYRWAGRVLGIRETLGESTGLGNPEERAERRRRLAGESGAPSEAEFAAACDEGRSMTLQQAIDAALEGAEDHP
jgi:non-specific serine/threonine protein kinase